MDDEDVNNKRKNRRKKRKIGRVNEYVFDKDKDDERKYENYLEDDFVVNDNDPIIYFDESYEKLNKNEMKELKILRQEIKEEEPSIKKILNANITKEDKKRCILLFDKWKKLDPIDNEYLLIQNSINSILNKYKNVSIKEVKILEEEENRLKNMVSDSYSPDINSLKNRILLLKADDNIKHRLYLKYLELQEHEVGSTSYASIKEEIEWSLKMPYQSIDKLSHLSSLNNQQLNDFYNDVMKKLDEELYGMKNVKARLLHILNDRISSNNNCGRNIALVGPPGVGKTQIGKVLAKILGLDYEIISVGGLDDSSILKGSDKVWQGASPSIVLQILSRMKTNSGIIIWDEVDKLGHTSRGKQAQHALLHISDYVHNKEFKDNYLNDFPYDISKVWNIYIMNDISEIDPAFKDRLDIIEVPSYNSLEKRIIFKQYMLPKALTNVKLDKNSVTLTDSAIDKLIYSISNSPGCRDIEKFIKIIVGRINMYKSASLKDKSMGKLELPYKISNFKFPLKLNFKGIKELTEDIVCYDNISYFN